VSILALEEYRQHFSLAVGYLDFARFGPPPDLVLAASADALAFSARDHADIDVLKDGETKSLATVARMTGRPSSDHVTFASSTSAANTLVAMALRGGDEAHVLVSPAEFPANVYPWVRAQNFGGPRVRWLECPDGKVTTDAVANALTDTTVALAVSGVDFRTGYRADLAGLREVLGDRLLLVDSIQGFGVCDLDWSLADAVMVGGQKWLRAGWGTGFISLSDRAVAHLGEGLAGWTAVEGPYRYDNVLHETVATGQRFSLTNCDLLAAARMSAALDLLEAVTVSEVERVILERVRALRETVASLGGAPIAELADHELSGIVSFRLPGVLPEQIHAHLRQCGIVVTKHDSYVRVSPHATTTSDEIDALGTALKELVS
jgi:selenocysteine lyase/cysteine desulfurase